MTQTTTAITPAAAPFDFAPLLASGLPAPAVKWNGFRGTIRRRAQ